MLRLVLSMSLISALLISCSKKEESAAEPEAKPTTPGEVNKEVAKPVEGIAAPAANAPLGVTECDDYIAKMNSCVQKLPEASRAATQTSIDTNRQQWQTLAATPEGKTQLATTCKTALDTAKKELSTQGCEF